ncbi:MAG: hypothetical protein SGILL_004470 [Bacillariaceae sp.]
MTSIATQLKETAEKRQLVVGILVFENVEVLDFCGPFEVLSVCRKGTSDDEDENVTTSPFDVKLIGLSSSSSSSSSLPVKTIGGMNVVPHTTMDEIVGASTADSSPLDILIVPGGMGTRAIRHDAKVLDFIRQQQPLVKIVASVCTGAMLLAEAGIFPAGTVITTHWKMIDTLQEWYPSLVIDKEHSVLKNDDGSMYTSAGISAGIDMTFRLVMDVFGEAVARATAKRMEYTYPEDYSRRIEI